MPLNDHQNTREYEKFVETSGGDTAVRVVPFNASGSSFEVVVKNKLITVEYDAITATYPTSTTEVFAYKTGGTGGTTVATVTVVYTNASKTDITSVEVT